jgi:hypothetical protein
MDDENVFPIAVSTAARKWNLTQSITDEISEVKFDALWLGTLKATHVRVTVHQCACYLFMVYLTTLSVSQAIASNERIIVNNELERMWK